MFTPSKMKDNAYFQSLPHHVVREYHEIFAIGSVNKLVFWSNLKMPVRIVMVVMNNYVKQSNYKFH